MEKEEIVQPQRAGEKAAYGIKLRLGLWNWRAALLLAVIAVVVLWLKQDLLWAVEEDGRRRFCAGFLALYAGFSLGGALLCITEFRLPDTVRRILSWVLVLLLPIGAFYSVDLINQTRILNFSFLRCFANYLCYLMVFALIYAVTRRAWLTALLGGIGCLGFGIINSFVVSFRGHPILPWDISAVGTAAEVSRGYKFLLTRPMLASLAGLFFAVLLCAKLGAANRRKAASRGSRLAERLCALGVSAVLAVLIFPCDLLTSMGISVWAWDQKTSAELTGVATGFFANVQFLLVDKPEGYSQEAVEELCRQTEAAPAPEALGSPKKAPTIIVVMNESMTDLQKVGDVTFSPDNLAYLHSLQGAENVIWGTAYSSVYGGDTCNSEYEFLTGNTTGFLPTGSKPYQQYVDRDQTALPSILEKQGYDRIAIHPGNKSAWQRDKAYPFLDFQEFIFAQAFDVQREKIHNLTSDRSHYRQIIHEYENRDRSKPLFLFTVTIQNHGGFEDDTVETTVRVKGKEAVWPQTEQYLSLTRLSDQALEEFMDYFKQEEDPVLIVFFGDHWPNLETGFLTKLLGTDARDLDFENTMRKYQVPFFLWANYPLKAGEIPRISLNYLSGLVLQAAGLEGSGYTRFLENLRQELPVINSLGFMDREGNVYKHGEESPYDELLNDYAILQYNNAFDREGKLEAFFAGGQ